MNLDRRGWVIVIVCIAIFFAYPFILKRVGLDRYLRPPVRPPAAVESTRVTPESSRVAVGPAVTPAPSTSVSSPQPVGSPSPAFGYRVATEQPRLERTIEVETPLVRAVFSSRGARLVAVELKHYASAHGISGRPPRSHRGEALAAGDRVVLAGGPSFALELGSGETTSSLGDVVYDVVDSVRADSLRTLSFISRSGDGLVIRQTYRIHPDAYAMDLDVEIQGIPLGSKLADYSLVARSWPLFTEHDPVVEERSLRTVSLVGTNLHRDPALALRRGPRVFEGNVLWSGVQTRYFLGVAQVLDAPAKSVIARSDLRPLTPDQQKILTAASKTDQPVAVSALVVAVPSQSRPVHHFRLYYGPNEYFRLAPLGMGRAVDLGWSWILPFSKALLQLLVWFYGVLRNYGIAIILLATLVRLVLHPLNMMSMKSMRAMQKLQPEMERIREKYKNDPQSMNTAVMALYRENKVNPAGGCLPMVIQMPLFIALYSVLYNAIELRQAPFLGWIRDLSAPDVLFSVAGFPVRLLPILMAGSGLLSQRLTPTDPRQATSMYLMNVMMLVFFYNLPSGLVLYWTVMNLLTALQQWLVLREDGSAGSQPAPVVAKRAGSK